MAKKEKKTKKIRHRAKKNVPTVQNNFDYTSGFWRKHFLVIPLFFLLSFVIYYQCIPFNYVLDDQIVIADNEYTKKGVAGLWDIFSTESFEGYFGKQRDLVQGGRYRPLSIMMFAVEHEISPLNYRLNHIVNIFFYSICCLLIYRVLSMFLSDKNSKWFLSVSFLVSLIFLAHPVHVEAVANIKGRDELLAMILGMASLYFAIRYMEKEDWKQLIYLAVIFYLGLLAKENVLTFAAVIPLTLWLWTKKSFKSIKKVIYVLIGVTAIYLVQRYAIIGYLVNTNPFNDVMNNPFAGMEGHEKYATIFYTLLKYLGLSIFPHPLTHDYYPYHIPIMNWAKPSVILSFFAHIVLFVVAVKNTSKRPVISWGILFYLLTISIVSNIVFSVGTFMNERFIFISSLGVVVLLVHLLYERAPKLYGFSKAIPLVILGLIFLAFSARSFVRVPVWENSLTLNTAAVKVSKNSARANSFMATALYQQSLEGNDVEEIMELLKKADFHADRALKVLPGYKNANLMKAGIAGEFHKKGGTDEALFETLKQVGANRPSIGFLTEYPDYMINRGKQEIVTDFYYELGYEVLLLEKRNPKWALNFLNKAYSQRASDPKIRKAIKESYELMGDFNKAKQFE